MKAISTSPLPKVIFLIILALSIMIKVRTWSFFGISGIEAEESMQFMKKMLGLKSGNLMAIKLSFKLHVESK